MMARLTASGESRIRTTCITQNRPVFPVSRQLYTDRPVGIVAVCLDRSGQVPIAHNLRPDRRSINDLTPLAPEVHAGSRPDFPVSAEQPRLLDRGERLEVGRYPGSAAIKRGLSDSFADERRRLRPDLLLVRDRKIGVSVPVQQLVCAVAHKRQSLRTTNQRTTPDRSGIGIPGILVDPPCNELGNPRIRVRVARRPDT